MIAINEQDKSVTVSNSDGDIVRIDGNDYALVDGGISVVNLPSYYDVEVYKKMEENHIPKPEPEPVEPLPEPIIEDPQEPEQ